jgi:hypothetical protein
MAESTLEWQKSLGWAVKRGLEITPDAFPAESAGYPEVVLAQRLRDVLLPKLSRGESRVTVAERFIKEWEL